MNDDVRSNPRPEDETEKPHGRHELPSDDQEPDLLAPDSDALEAWDPDREEPAAHEPGGGEPDAQATDSRTRAERAGAEREPRDGEPDDGGEGEPEDGGEREEWGDGVLPPPAVAPGRRRSPAGVLIGVLLALLGFGLAVQVRSNTSTSGLPSARQEDLVRILDELSSREERLRRQISSLEAAKARLSTTGDRSEVALSEARTRSTNLGILAGTIAAQGPGIQLILSDPGGKLTAEDLLDAVEELRAAGAEAIQVGSVRIGLDSSFTATEDGLAVDGQRVDAPYTIFAIGDPPTLATAMGIPGGVIDSARRAGGEARISQQPLLVIRALRTVRPPQYSRPADGGR